MADFNTTRKLKNTLTVWRNLTFFDFSNIHVFRLEVTLWVNSCQVVAIFVSSNDSISHILNLTVGNDTNIVRKVDRTKRTKVSTKDLTSLVFCSWFKEVRCKEVLQLHIINIIITHEKGDYRFIICHKE